MAKNVQVLVGEELHRAVRVAAAMRGETIKEYTERALIAALPPSFLPGPVELSTESVERAMEACRQ